MTFMGSIPMKFLCSSLPAPINIVGQAKPLLQTNRTGKAEAYVACYFPTDTGPTFFHVTLLLFMRLLVQILKSIFALLWRNGVALNLCFRQGYIQTCTSRNRCCKNRRMITRSICCIENGIFRLCSMPQWALFMVVFLLTKAIK